MLYVSGNHHNKFLLGILRDFYLAIKILSDSDSDSDPEHLSPAQRPMRHLGTDTWDIGLK